MRTYELILVGGGLQNAAIALAAAAVHPSTRVAIVERDPVLGGNHTWCFHAGDVSEAAAAWLAPLVVQRWPGYQVAFPTYTRAIGLGYAAIASERLDPVVRALPSVTVVRGEAAAVEPGAVTLVGGARLEAGLVVDSRGPERAPADDCGWQKFVGLELDTAAPHGLTAPILMDATVAQLDGFRFFYVLPLTDRRLLVEDTYFSERSELDVDAIRAEILAYAAARGWHGAIARTERGVLPMSWQAQVVRPEPGLIVGGYQGGWMNPATGYSLAGAVRLAEAIAAGLADGDVLAHARAAADAHAHQLAFTSRLTRMMFRWFAPDQRRGSLSHFYRLPEPTIARFYASRMTRGDRMRVFLRRPPPGLSWRAVLTGAVAS